MPLYPSWVKNVSRRVLWAAIEKDIDKKERKAMREFFFDKCAYCEEPLGSRWHADHLIPIDDKGGFNHISNRVPACAKCNEQEKREQNWLTFLTRKCGDGQSLQFKNRKRAIESWSATHYGKIPRISKKQRALWKRETDRVAAAIDASWKTLKATTEQ